MFSFTKLPVKTYCLRYYLINKKSLNLVRPLLQINNCAQICLNNNTLQTSNLLKRNNLFLDISRHKSKGGKRKYGPQSFDEDDEDDDDDDDKDDFQDEDEKFKTKGVDVKTVQTDSIRVDKVIKAGLKLERKKIETAFYHNKFRVNEKRLLKKGAKVNIGDEIDLIRDIPTQNPNHLNVSRIEVLDIKIDQEKAVYVLKLKVFKLLLIENYDRTGREEEESAMD